MRKYNVIITDDNPIDRMILRKMLESDKSFEIFEAENGIKCTEILNKQKVDLVLLDILMPGELGTETLTKIRSKYNQLELPVIMITASDYEGDLIKCLDSGANDYISKPVNFKIAHSRILTHINASEVLKNTNKVKEISALSAIVATYNHEINNPLTIALTSLKKATWPNKSDYEKVEQSLWRIADIVKKIEEINDNQSFEIESYVENIKMMKLK